MPHPAEKPVASTGSAKRAVLVFGLTAVVGAAIEDLLAERGPLAVLAVLLTGAAVAVTARTEAEWDARLPGTVYDTVAEARAKTGATEQINIADLAGRDANLDVGEIKDELALVSEAGLPLEVKVIRGVRRDIEAAPRGHG